MIRLEWDPAKDEVVVQGRVSALRLMVLKVLRVSVLGIIGFRVCTGYMYF